MARTNVHKNMPHEVKRDEFRKRANTATYNGNRNNKFVVVLNTVLVLSSGGGRADKLIILVS